MTAKIEVQRERKRDAETVSSKVKGTEYQEDKQKTRFIKSLEKMGKVVVVCVCVIIFLFLLLINGSLVAIFVRSISSKGST